MKMRASYRGLSFGGLTGPSETATGWKWRWTTLRTLSKTWMWERTCWCLVNPRCDLDRKQEESIRLSVRIIDAWDKEQAAKGIQAKLWWCAVRSCRPACHRLEMFSKFGFSFKFKEFWRTFLIGGSFGFSETCVKIVEAEMLGCD
jgi:hypothetical protein